jgi:hypothetical protein
MEQHMEKPEVLMITQQSLQSENFKEMLSIPNQLEDAGLRT